MTLGGPVLAGRGTGGPSKEGPDSYTRAIGVRTAFGRAIRRPPVTAQPPAAFGLVAPVAYHHLEHGARIRAAPGAPPPGSSRRLRCPPAHPPCAQHDGSGDPA
ncbi:DUF5941 domain-containing protein [Streptomyces rubellomurinus]|uniref:DUF5941 domain-containing protein n=1 Tax=Streptomyces sp. Y1 TaxID=3238634 RepID=A0AB39TDK2_9ACTN